VGALIYFLIFKFTGFRIKLLAVGVGALVGWGAELLGRGEGSNELGGITAVFALVGIIGAQYFVALSWWHQFSPVQISIQPTPIA
jgi:disulfide bond formation protein DsbB